MLIKSRYRHIFMLCFLLLPLAVIGQQSEKEISNYKRLKKSDAKSADVLLDEARVLKEKAPAEALNKVEEALGISLAQQDIFGEGRCYVLLGEINEGIQEWKLALANYTEAYQKLGTAHKSSTEYKHALRGLAGTNLRLGNHDAALRYYEACLALKLTPLEDAHTQLGISEVYYQVGRYDDALRTVQSINVQRPGGKIATNDALEVDIQNQKAKIYARQNEADKAKLALQSSQQAASANTGAVPKKQALALKDAKEEVVDVLHEQQRYDEEIDLRNQSIEMNLKSNNLPEVTKDKVGLSKALEAKGETSEAIRELEEAALMADTLHNPKDQARAFLALADLYDKNGRTTQAIKTYKRYSEAVSKAAEQDQMKLTEKTALISKQRDIQVLTKDVALGQQEETIAKATVAKQQLIIYGLVLIILIIAVTSYFIYKSAQASKVANQLLALKSLRSQMNPHFIFNALNSVNHFVSQHDERTANKFLSEFSRLMRLVLENSQEDFIPLVTEREIISLYLKLEHYRFRDKFDYEITIDDSIDLETTGIPPMLLQPYIENAVWHGLRYKETKGHLSLHLRRNGKGLEVEIADNGIGRKRSAELKTVNQKKQVSTGLKNIHNRLTIINKVYKTHYHVAIADGDASTGSGTRVLIHVPEHREIDMRCEM